VKSNEYHYAYGFDYPEDDEDDQDDEFLVAENSLSSQFGDTMDNIRLLTEREIVEELEVEGGRKEPTNTHRRRTG